MLGSEVFQQDSEKAEKAAAGVGVAAETAAKKTKPLGTELDETAKKASASKAPLDETAKSTKTVGEESAKATPKIKVTGESIEQLRARADAARRTVGTAFLAIGGAAGVMSIAAVSKFADFDKGMSAVQASTHAAAGDMSLLADAAIDAGADTSYSAREAADAEDELAKAGLGVKDVLSGGLRGSLSLAAAGQLDVARAASIAATTLSVFNLAGNQTEHVADLLAAGAGKAQGSVDDLALGLDYVGVSMAQFKVPLEEVVGGLALFASNGVLGEKAGTGLRGVMAALTGPSAIGARTMAEYGVNVFDAQGKFIGLAGAAEQLKTSFIGLSDEERSAAMNRIFGNESMTAANILLKAGAAGVQEWTANVNDAGYAAKTAAMLQDNLAGDVEKLGGAFDSALIQTGSAANDVLREMVQTVSFLIDSYAALPDELQGGTLAVGAGTAGVLLLTGAFLLAVPKIAEFKVAMSTLGLSVGGTALKFGIAGAAVGIYAYLISGAIAAQADMAATGQELADSLDKSTGAFTAYSREIVAKKLQDSGAAEQYAKYGVSLDTLTDAAFNNADAIKQVRKAAEEYGTENPWDALNYAVGDADRTLVGLQKNVQEAPGAWAELQRATDGSAGSAEDASESYGVLTEQVSDLTAGLQDLAKEIDEANGKNLGARESARALEQAYDDFEESVKENGKTLETTTQAGRDNQAALDAIAGAAVDAGQAIIDSGGGYAEYQTSLETSRQSIIDRIGLLGITGQAASDLADDILRIPTKAEFEAIANTAAAEERLRVLTDLLNGIGATAELHVSNGKGSGGLTQADGGRVDFYANGGRSENHIAQFARAGTMRVWAEPETGGEYYIPASPAKRGRSSQVLAAAAAEFGYTLTPAGAQAFADGGRAGVTTPTTSTGGDIYNENHFHLPPGPDAESQAKIIARELGELAGRSK